MWIVDQIVVEPTAKAFFAVATLNRELPKGLLAKYPSLKPYETVLAGDMRAGSGKINTAIFASETLTATFLAIFYRS
jgi:hypothetical protein